MEHDAEVAESNGVRVGSGATNYGVDNRAGRTNCRVVREELVSSDHGTVEVGESDSIDLRIEDLVVVDYQATEASR